ncbi:hypothetical protein V8E52_010771 [Russula decolorans]
MTTLDVLSSSLLTLTSLGTGYASNEKMRRYNIVYGILLILSIIDFALAAPVLVQEKRQACVDVVHIPRDEITVLGKRGFEHLDKFASLAEAYFKTLGKPVESSDAHASSSSAPLGPDHGSTNVVQAPAPNPALSTTNPSPLMEPSSPSSTASSGPTLSDSEDLKWLPQPNPKKRPWTDLDPEPDFNWNHRMNFPGLADGWTGLKQPLLSVPEEPSPVSSPNHAPPSPGDRLNALLLKLFGQPKGHFFAKPEESSAARPSSSSPPSGPTDGWTDVEQPLPSIPEEPSPVSSPDRAPPSPGDGLNELLLKLFGPPRREPFFSQNRSRQPHIRHQARSRQGPLMGRRTSSNPLPSIPEEPSPVSNPGPCTAEPRIVDRVRP